MARASRASPYRWTSSDLDLLPEDEWTRYEIIDGELYVAKAPRWEHQRTCGRTAWELEQWARTMGGGQVLPGPGFVFSESDDVIPDLVWISEERFPAIVGEDGHFHAAPELVVEVLSPGPRNEERDRVAKLRLYSRQGVLEYWIVDWRGRTIAVYRRRGVGLRLVATLQAEDELTSPLLPGFRVPVASLFPSL